MNRLFFIFVLIWIASVGGGIEMEKFRPIKADIALAIDTAYGDNVRSPDLLDVEVIQHFLRKITTAFPLSPKHTRMAIIEFAGTTRVRLSLSEGIDEKAVDATYDDLFDWYDEEGIDRHLPVNYQAMYDRVHREVFIKAEGERPDTPNILIILTLLPSLDGEDPVDWRQRAGLVARGLMYNYSDPAGVVITTSYATLRGTHLPKFTLVRGVGTFDPDMWYYEDFSHVVHYAVIHLRHAVRSSWVNAFYTGWQLRRIRTFGYTTCTVDPELFSKAPDPDQLGLFDTDIIFAIEIDQSMREMYQDQLRTLVLNVTRYLPISENLIRVAVVEFQKDGTFQILTTEIPSGFCSNQTTLHITLTEKWAPQSSSRYQSLMKELSKGYRRAENGAVSTKIVNLDRLRSSVQKALPSGRVPQLFIAIVVYPHTTPTGIESWVSDFFKENSGKLQGGPDALIVTNGKENMAYTVALSPLVPTGSIQLTTPHFQDTRGKMFEFVINVTKAASSRCSRCFYDSDGRCVVDGRVQWRNVSKMVFMDGRYCQNASGFMACSSPKKCIQECERRPWGEWGSCGPSSIDNAVRGYGTQRRRRIGLNFDDTDNAFYKNCPVQERQCFLGNAIRITAIFLG